jgi:hypothetical protein
MSGLKRGYSVGRKKALWDGKREYIHWRETQTQADKSEYLAAAEAKRLRRAAKRGGA